MKNIIEICPVGGIYGTVCNDLRLKTGIQCYLKHHFFGEQATSGSEQRLDQVITAQLNSLHRESGLEKCEKSTEIYRKTKKIQANRLQKIR